MAERNSFLGFQDYFEPGEYALPTLIVAKDYLLNSVPEAKDMRHREHHIKIAGISFRSGLESLLLKGVKPVTIKNSADVRMIQFLLRLSHAEVDAIADETTVHNRNRALEIFDGLLERGTPIPSELIGRIEGSALAPNFRTQLAELRKPLDLSTYQPYMQMTLMQEFGY